MPLRVVVLFQIITIILGIFIAYNLKNTVKYSDLQVGVLVVSGSNRDKKEKISFVQFKTGIKQLN
jgi:hypothetical protein